MESLINAIEDLESSKAHALDQICVPCADATEEEKNQVKKNNEVVYGIKTRIESRIRGMVEAALLLGVKLERDEYGKWRAA